MRFEVGPYAVEWYRKANGWFWYEVYEGEQYVVRGWSAFPPQELDTAEAVKTLTDGLRKELERRGIRWDA